MSEKSGAAVIEQADDDGFWNTDPAIAKGAVTGAAAGVTTIAVVFGVMEESQREPLIAAVGETAFWAVTALTFIVPIVQAAWTRLSVWSPRTAARVALANAQRAYAAGREGAAPPPPTLAPPP